GPPGTAGSGRRFERAIVRPSTPVDWRDLLDRVDSDQRHDQLRSQPAEREVRLSRVRVDDSGRLWSGRLADAQPAAGTRRKQLSCFRSLREPQPQTVRTIA